FNTVDAGAPTSSVNPLPATSGSPFTVSWSGSDDAGGSGIAGHDVFVSDNSGPFTPFLTGTTQTSASFAGVPGHTYRFYSVATDNAGHVQATPLSAQASITVVPPSPPPPTQPVTNVTALVQVKSGKAVLNRHTHRWQQTVTVRNTSTKSLQGPITLVLDGL